MTWKEAFQPGRLGPLELKNRFIRTAAFEGMTPGGMPSPALLRHHEELAKGGVAMTTVSYCSVLPEGRTFEDQMVMTPEVSRALRPLTEAVHREGAAASIQLGHAGLFADKRLAGGTPRGPSRIWNTYGMAWSRPMTEDEIHETAGAFASAAELASEAGFDAVELHLGHGYLLSQFLSPATNRRTDQWGGTLEGRMKFPLLVAKRVLEAVGGRLAVIAKVNLTDGFPGGLGLEEALVVAARLESVGMHGLVLSGGFVSRTPFFMLRGRLPVREMVAAQKGLLRKMGLALFGRLLVREYPYRELFFLEEASRVRKLVSLPLVYVGGVTSMQSVETVLKKGFEFVALGRALIMEPHFVRKAKERSLLAVECDHCNRCVAAMETGGIRCITKEMGMVP